jgi:OmpA-OmpF porin, OOP family
MNQLSLRALLVGASLLFTVGCATKSYVRDQMTPTINRVNELDDVTAKNTRDIKDVDARSQQGIEQVDQKALAAGQSANQANQNATQTGKRVTNLAGTVENLDNYKPVNETTVLFGFNKAELTSKDKQTLDDFGQQIQGQKHYIIQVEGYTDSVGSADYNYQLSQHRADAVIRYLAQKYDVPAYRIFLIGLGKDNPVAENTSASGRAQNRRVDVRLMTNSLTESASVHPQQ